MIRVTLQGRLGNWLFQYAAGRALALALALRHGTEVVLDLAQRTKFRDPLALRVRCQLAHFPIRARFAIRSPFSRAKPSCVESRWGFDASVLRLDDGVWLEGFFQSSPYAESVPGALRDELTPRVEDIAHRDPSLEAAIVHTTSVAIHVRCTDYVGKVNRHLCTTAYYARAMAYCREQLGTAQFFGSGCKRN